MQQTMRRPPRLRPPKKAKGQNWVDPICTTATVVTGGRSNRYHVVETKEIQSTNGVIRKFVRASKNDDWVLKIVLGDTAFRGGLKRTTLVEELENHHVEHSASARAADDDPMAALDGGEIAATHS